MVFNICLRLPGSLGLQLEGCGGFWQRLVIPIEESSGNGSAEKIVKFSTVLLNNFHLPRKRDSGSIIPHCVVSA